MGCTIASKLTLGSYMILMLQLMSFLQTSHLLYMMRSSRTSTVTRQNLPFCHLPCIQQYAPSLWTVPVESEVLDSLVARLSNDRGCALAISSNVNVVTFPEPLPWT
jgi:hypothetical protein